MFVPVRGLSHRTNLHTGDGVGMAVARPEGRLKGKQSKLSGPQRKPLFETHDRGEYTPTELAELFSVSRATVYRELQHRRQAFPASCEAHIY